MTDKELDDVDKLIEWQKTNKINAVTAYNVIVPKLVEELRQLREQRKWLQDYVDVKG